MTKSEAVRAIGLVSSGTIACIIKDCRYSAIDKALYTWIKRIGKAEENAFKDCENWMHVLDIIR